MVKKCYADESRHTRLRKCLNSLAFELQRLKALKIPNIQVSKPEISELRCPIFLLNSLIFFLVLSGHFDGIPLQTREYGGKAVGGYQT